MLYFKVKEIIEGLEERGYSLRRSGENPEIGEREPKSERPKNLGACLLKSGWIGVDVPDGKTEDEVREDLEDVVGYRPKEKFSSNCNGIPMARFTSSLGTLDGRRYAERLVIRLYGLMKSSA